LVVIGSCSFLLCVVDAEVVLLALELDLRHPLAFLALEADAAVVARRRRLVGLEAAASRRSRPIAADLLLRMDLLLLLLLGLLRLLLLLLLLLVGVQDRVLRADRGRKRCL